MEKDVRTVSADAMTLLVRYAWPGNVRELEHAIERGVILARDVMVTIRDLPPEIALDPAGIRASATFNLKESERRLIREALEKFKRNRRRAAEALNISPVTLWRKMKDYGLSVE